MGEVPYNEDFVYKAKHIPVGSRDRLVAEIPAYKHRDWTQNEVYGSQYDNKAYEKIYLTDAPHIRKEKEIQKSWKKSKKSSDQYGQFYSPRMDDRGRRLYDVDRTLLPPSNSRLDDRYNPLNQAVNTINVNNYPNYNTRLPSTPRSLPPISTPRGTNAHITNRDPYSDVIVRLPEIKSIDLNIKTTDFTSINVYPGKYGLYEHSSYPDGIRSFAVPDIKEINIRIRNQDGSYTNLTTVPKQW